MTRHGELPCNWVVFPALDVGVAEGNLVDHDNDRELPAELPTRRRKIMELALQTNVGRFGALFREIILGSLC